MKTRTIKIGSRVSFQSKRHEGTGVVTGIAAKATGAWYTVKTKAHPTGQVTVRRSQVL